MDAFGQIIAQADIPDTRVFGKSVVQTVKTQYLIDGSASAAFTVERNPDTAILRRE